MSIRLLNPAIAELDNFKTLSSRQRGDVYFLENGYLKKMSFIQKIFLAISKMFFNVFHLKSTYFEKNQKDLGLVINSIVSKITGYKEEELKEFFFERISALPEEIYDRSKINKTALRILKTSLESSEDLQKIDKKIKEFKQKKDQKKSSFEYEELKNRLIFERYKRVLIDAKVSCNLGVRAKKPGGGFSKTYFIKNINHEIVGVFKPGSSDSLSTKAPFFPMRILNKAKHFENMVVNAIRKRSIVKKPINEYLARKCHFAEAMSFEMDKELNLGLVPSTEVVLLNPIKYKRKFFISWPWITRKNTLEQEGSFQLFIKGAKPATEFFNINKKTYKQKGLDIYDKELSDELFDDLIIDDVITGNLDRHAENFLILPDEKNPNIAKKIILIDGGMAFAPKHPTGWEVKHKKQYAWASDAFIWSQKKFTSHAKAIIKDIYSKKLELSKKVYDFYISEGEDEEVSKERANRVLDRIDVLYYGAIVKDERKFNLKNYRTNQAIRSVKKELQEIK